MKAIKYTTTDNVILLESLIKRLSTIYISEREEKYGYIVFDYDGNIIGHITQNRFEVLKKYLKKES